MDKKFGLPIKTIQNIQRVLSTFPEIHTAILYGSRAMGNYKNGSDIDLTLISSHKQPKKTSITDISAALDELDLPYTFDLSHYEKITNLDLCNHIDRVGIIFYEKNIK